MCIDEIGQVGKQARETRRTRNRNKRESENEEKDEKEESNALEKRKGKSEECKRMFSTHTSIPANTTPTTQVS